MRSKLPVAVESRSSLGCSTDTGAGARERDRGLDGRISAAADQNPPALEIGGVVHAVMDLLEVLARNAEPAHLPGAADGHGV